MNNAYVINLSKFKRKDKKCDKIHVTLFCRLERDPALMVPINPPFADNSRLFKQVTISANSELCY